MSDIERIFHNIETIARNARSALVAMATSLVRLFYNAWPFFLAMRFPRLSRVGLLMVLRALLAILIDEAADELADADVEPSGVRLQESQPAGAERDRETFWCRVHGATSVMRGWCERHRNVCIIQIDAVHSVSDRLLRSYAQISRAVLHGRGLRIHGREI